MAYKIQYTPEQACRYPLVKKGRTIKLRKWIPLILLIMAAVCLRIYGIPDFLIPGDPKVTKAATEMMIRQIQSGESVNDAVTVFCRQILNGAGF